MPKMPEDPVKELRELVDNLSDWVQYQRRLGWRGAPGKVAPQVQEREKSTDKIFSLEEIRAEMGDCRRCKLYGGRIRLVFGDGDANARDPEADEIAACLPFLEKQIKAIRPRVIVTLGRISTHALLGTKVPLTRLRGQWQRYHDIRVMPTFHPSYLLRSPQERHKTWADMQQVMEYLTDHEET